MSLIIALLLATCPCEKPHPPTLKDCVAIADEAESKRPGWYLEYEATLEAVAQCVREVESRQRRHRR